MRKLFIPAILILGACFLGGCSGDKDPGEKIDAPGYYNGPMEPRGGGAGGGDAKAAPTGEAPN